MSEFRKDPITGQWRIIAGGRSARPNEYAESGPVVPSDALCPFCVDNESSTPPEVAAVRPRGGIANGPGWTLRSFLNRYPTVANVADHSPEETEGWFERSPGTGAHEVIVMAPRHAPGLSHFESAHARSLFRFFRDRVRDASLRPSIAASLLFENGGPESGGTLRHPHAQLITTGVVPPRLIEEAGAFRRGGSGGAAGCLLESMVRAELAGHERMISDDGVLATFAPFASAHPYEVWIVPHRHAATYGEATDDEIDRLAERLPAILRALEGIRPHASYNWFVHGLGPPPGGESDFHWHVEIAPRLVRPDGFEIAGGIPVNPMPPEVAAAEFRAQLAEGAPSAGRKR